MRRAKPLSRIAPTLFLPVTIVFLGCLIENPVDPLGSRTAALFTASCAALVCTFAVTEPQNRKASYHWDLGDGAQAEGTRVEHRYSSRDGVTVVLTITDDVGRTDTESTSVDPSNGAPSTWIFPGESIQAAVDAHPEGTEFLIKAGLHRIETIVPKSQNKFVGEDGAVLSGARLILDYQMDNGLWFVDGQTQQGARFGPNEYGAEVCDSSFPRCVYPEDLFVDNVPLRHVASVAEVGPGKWYFDYAADRFYFYDDPRARTVEASVTAQAFASSNVSDVLIQNLVIEKFANAGQVGAIQNLNGDDWIIRDNEIRLNHGVGIAMAGSSNTQILNNFVHSNGQLGIGTWGAIDLLVADNDISSNNYAGYDHTWEGGGTKFSNTLRLVLRANRATLNRGPGLWLDIDNRDALVELNSCESNTAFGIHHEIGYSATIRDNTVVANGWSGIIVDKSSNVEVYGNTLRGNNTRKTPEWWEIWVRQDVAPWEGGFGLYIVENVRVFDNTISGEHLAALTAPDSSYFFTRNNVFDGNVYDLTSAAARPFHWLGEARDEGEWVALGNDINGVVNR